MTTAQPRSRTLEVPARVSAVVTLAVGVLAIVAGLLDGHKAAVAVLGGGLGALLLLLVGAGAVALALRAVPQQALAAALLTYVLQIVLAGVALLAVRRSAVVSTDLLPWLAGSLLVACLAWTIGLVVVSLRVRIPAYDLPDDHLGPSPSRVPEASAP